MIDRLIFGRVSADRPADHKEAFNITEPCNEQRVSWMFQHSNNLLSLEFYLFVRIWVIGKRILLLNCFFLMHISYYE